MRFLGFVYAPIDQDAKKVVSDEDRARLVSECLTIMGDEVETKSLLEQHQHGLVKRIKLRRFLILHLCFCKL